MFAVAVKNESVKTRQKSFLMSLKLSQIGTVGYQWAASSNRQRHNQWPRYLWVRGDMPPIFTSSGTSISMSPNVWELQSWNTQLIANTSIFSARNLLLIMQCFSKLLQIGKVGHQRAAISNRQRHSSGFDPYARIRFMHIYILRIHQYKACSSKNN